MGCPLPNNNKCKEFAAKLCLILNKIQLNSVIKSGRGLNFCVVTEE